MSRASPKKTLRAATLADVGREAGVSAMAASAVLNGARTSSRIAADTRDRILKAAARLSYRPNAAARALAARRMHALGVAAVMEGGAFNQYFLEIFNGVITAAARHGQNTTVFTLHDWTHAAGRLAGFCDGRIDGLVLIAPLLTPAQAAALPAHTPFAAIHANHRLPGMVNLETDEETGACEIVRHLIARGHRRILHLTGPRGLLGVERRIRGYRRALAAARIPFDPALLVEAGYSPEGGRQAFGAWLARSAGRPLPQALFCGNDGIASGCIETLAGLGLKAPEDVSIAGFDDTLTARTTVPQLTTVRQPLRAMGERAVEALLARLQHPRADAAAKTIVLPTELVIRASVAAPPAAPRTVPAL